MELFNTTNIVLATSVVLSALILHVITTQFFKVPKNLYAPVYAAVFVGGIMFAVQSAAKLLFSGAEGIVAAAVSMGVFLIWYAASFVAIWKFYHLKSKTTRHIAIVWVVTMFIVNIILAELIGAMFAPTTGPAEVPIHINVT